MYIGSFKAGCGGPLLSTKVCIARGFKNRFSRVWSRGRTKTVAMLGLAFLPFHIFLVTPDGVGCPAIRGDRAIFAAYFTRAQKKAERNLRNEERYDNRTICRAGSGAGVPKFCKL